MIAHVVTITWTEGGHPDPLGLSEALRAAAASVPSIAFYRVGATLNLRPGADFGVVAIADDASGLAAYLDAPVHIDIVERDMKPYIATRQAVQLDIGDVPFAMPGAGA
ncbi:MAG TPA: Dabb family protein [Pseudolysinimonas sp.]|jgi:hypothetical protein|nr:Dabb family protein [Pseudolysinimonas sp.]